MANPPMPDWASTEGPWCLYQWLPLRVPDPKIDTCLLPPDHEGDCRGIYGRYHNPEVSLVMGRLERKVTPISISVEEAEEIIDSDNFVDRYGGEEHRWYRDIWYVIEREGSLYEFRYMQPSTEMQEGQDCFDDPVPLFQVRAEEVVRTIYKRVDA